MAGRKIVGTPYVLSTEVVIDTVKIVVGYSSEWPDFLVNSEKGYVAPLIGVKFHFMSVCSL